MKISPINYNSVQLSNTPSNRGFSTFKKNAAGSSNLLKTSPLPGYCPAFCANLNSKKTKPFSGEKSLERFNNLSDLQRDIQYEKISSECKKAADYSIETGILIKQFLDEVYGADGYSFVSVGTSPAGVARVMEYLGADVKYMPISKLGGKFARLTGDCNDGNDLGEYLSKEYCAYLDSIGLTKSEVEKSGRKPIVCDYCESERTLDKITYYLALTREIPVSCINMNNIVLRRAEYSKYPEKVVNYAWKYLRNGAISEFAGVPHLDYKHTEQITELVNKNPSKESKEFDFTLLYQLKNRGLI